MKTEESVKRKRTLRKGIDQIANEEEYCSFSDLCVIIQFEKLKFIGSGRKNKCL